MSTGTTATGAPAPESRSTGELTCGVCGGAIGYVTLPPPPSFASLDWKLRTLIAPLLDYAERHAPQPLPDVLRTWRAGTAPLTAESFAALLAPGVRCADCRDKTRPFRLVVVA